MNHFSAFQKRKLHNLPAVEEKDWALKRYAILAENRLFDEKVCDTALQATLTRLPKAGNLENFSGNHGIGFQIIHFADTAIVAPTFYWIWGSVLANTTQIRALWEDPTKFSDGVGEVLGCVWEMDLVTFEVGLWKNTMLSGSNLKEQKQRYLNKCLQEA